MKKLESPREKLAQLNKLRGLFALEIIIGHVVRYEASILYPLGKFMICSVAFFFFVSAYGMVLSTKDKENYLNASFLIKKPLYLTLVTIAMYIINSLVDLALGGKSGHSAAFLSPYNFFNKTNWYLVELTFLYIIFWISYKFIYKYRLIVMTIVVITGMTTVYYMGAKEGWYASCCSFLLGLYFGECDKLLELTHSIVGIITIIVTGVFGLLSLFITNETFVTMVLMRNSICIAVIIVTILISRLTILGDNPVSRFLTKYSMALYLSQFIWLEYMYYFSDNLWLRILIVAALTFALAIIVVNPVTKLIRKVLK